MFYSIGTSNRAIDEFIHELTSRGVIVAIDVRTRPNSRFSWFRKNSLSQHLKTAGIDYVWLGSVLGGHISLDDNITKHLHQMIKLSHDGPLAYFCAEGDPINCHRTTLVGRQLLEDCGIVTSNILRDGSVEDIDSTLLRLR